MTEAPWTKMQPPRDGLAVRPSARLLVLDTEGRALLFRFRHQRGPLKGRDFWATPGGGLDPGESFEAAAHRELEEETGLRVDKVGPALFHREIVMQLPEGEHVICDERYFVIRASAHHISRNGWTALEHEVMQEHRWWSVAALKATTEIVFPEGLADMLDGLS